MARQMPGGQFPFNDTRKKPDDPEKDVSSDTTQDPPADTDSDAPSDSPWNYVNPNVSNSPAPKLQPSYPKYHNLIKRQRWTRTDTDPKTNLKTKTQIDMVNNPSFLDRWLG